MKICFIADSSSIHVKRIAKYHLKQRDEVFVVSTSTVRSDIPGAKMAYLIAAAEREPGMAPANGRSRMLQNLLRWGVPRGARSYLRRTLRDLSVLRSRRTCAEEMAEFNPDIVFCHRAFPEGVLASWCYAKPLVIRTAGPDISKWPKYPVYRQLIRYGLRSTSLILTESAWEKDWLRRLCGGAVRIEVSIIGIDTVIFQPQPMREKLRERYGLPKDAFVVVTNRYLTGHYNGWLVVEALESIMRDHPRLILLYASPLKMDADTKARAEAVMSRCSAIRIFEGPITQLEVADILACGDLYVSFSSYDGIPNSVLEAMACGLVPVVADLPQLHEWIDSGVDGYHVPQYDKEALASMVSDLYWRRGALPQMAARCVEKIRTRASYELCSEKTRCLMKNLATTHGPGKKTGVVSGIELDTGYE